MHIDNVIFLSLSKFAYTKFYEGPRDGNNVDVLLREAVVKAMAEIRELDIDCAILQSRSPTCGVNQVYDGTFSGKLIPGSGVFAQALKDAGYRVIDAEDV